MDKNKFNNQNENVTFEIQVGGNPNSSVTPQASVSDFIKGTKEELDKINDVIEFAGQVFADKISKIASKPSEFSVEFGINVGGEAGIPFVTKGTIGANFKVSITWKMQN